MFYAQQCLKYQQNEQLLLTSNHRTQEKRTRYADDKSGPWLRTGTNMGRRYTGNITFSISTTCTTISHSKLIYCCLLSGKQYFSYSHEKKMFTNNK